MVSAWNPDKKPRQQIANAAILLLRQMEHKDWDEKDARKVAKMMITMTGDGDD